MPLLSTNSGVIGIQFNFSQSLLLLLSIRVFSNAYDTVTFNKLSCTPVKLKVAFLLSDIVPLFNIVAYWSSALSALVAKNFIDDVWALTSVAWK